MYDWHNYISPGLSFVGGLVGSIITLWVGLKRLKINEKTLQQQKQALEEQKSMNDLRIQNETKINEDKLINEKRINDMKLQADVVAKSRMEWIKEVRQLSARLLKTYTEMYEKQADFDSLQSKIQKQSEIIRAMEQNDDYEKYKNSINQLSLDNQNKLIELENYIKIISSYLGELYEIDFLFKSYFANRNSDNTINERNQQITNSVSTCILQINAYCKNPEETNKTVMDESLDNFSELFSNYIKEEWEKVKTIQ